MSREPHRDTRNGPCGTYFQVLSEVVGGGLWIAHKNGCIARSHNGAQVQGFDLEAKEVPVVFDARRCLHASQSWDKTGLSKRVVLIAWTVIHVRTMSEQMLQQLRELGFPVPTESDLTSDVPDSWIPDSVQESQIYPTEVAISSVRRVWARASWKLGDPPY